MKIYMKPRGSHRYLLTVLMVLAAIYIGIVAALWGMAPGHPAMIALVLICAATALIVLSFAVQRHFPFALMSIIYLTYFATPVGLALIAIVLTAGSDTAAAVALPYTVLIYLLTVTAIEYSRINFKALPKKVTDKPFRKAADDALSFDPHVSVLFLSPWRKANGFPRFNIPGMIGALALFVVIFAIAIALAPTGTRGSESNVVALGWMLALIALLMRPFLLAHLIRLKLVLMKARGAI